MNEVQKCCLWEKVGTVIVHQSLHLSPEAEGPTNLLHSAHGKAGLDNLSRFHSTSPTVRPPVFGTKMQARELFCYFLCLV